MFGEGGVYDVDDVSVEDLPPITRRMVERALTNDMEIAEKGDMSDLQYLQYQIATLGDMFTYAFTLLEIKLNKLVELTGHDIELTDKT